MRPIILAVLLSFLFTSCKQNGKTLEDLEKSKWTSLTPGIDFISTQNSSKTISEKDSFILKLKGYQKGGEEPVETSIRKADTINYGFISDILKEHLKRSETGYLKINLIEMFKSSSLTGNIYLRGDYTDPFSFAK